MNAETLLGAEPAARLREHLLLLYPAPLAESTLEALAKLLDRFRSAQPAPAMQRRRLDQTDMLLITYGDQLREPGKPPLQSLYEVLRERADWLTGVHLLPFYPYTSDDGFSVVDYVQVDPALGEWPDVTRFKTHLRLMFDAVINHISASSAWFQGFLQGDPRYSEFFISVDPLTDLALVVRPRALPLLTRFETVAGPRYVWTTFSADQIDLNFENPQVLLAMCDVLLQYAGYGADYIRLDAITYLWKTIGTRCVHLPQTHEVVKLWRSMLDLVAPHVLLITETNVPHHENISYFGNGSDEAQLVYQFALPPLILHSFATADATALQQWAAGLQLPSDNTTFFNFLASHDGIGVRPVEGILAPEQVAALLQRVQQHGGFVSYKNNADGSQSPYELNISYFDALNDPAGAEPLQLQVQRFMAAQAILLALQGMPGVYVHSLFGSRNWRAGVEQTGRYRTINRQKFERAELEAELADPGSLRAQVFARFAQLFRARQAEAAFDPYAPQQVLPSAAGLFCLLRQSVDAASQLLALHSLSPVPQGFRYDLGRPGLQLRDLLSDARYDCAADGSLQLELAPYQVLWLSFA